MRGHALKLEWLQPGCSQTVGPCIRPKLFGSRAKKPLLPAALTWPDFHDQALCLDRVLVTPGVILGVKLGQLQHSHGERKRKEVWVWVLLGRGRKLREGMDGVDGGSGGGLGGCEGGRLLFLWGAGRVGMCPRAAACAYLACLV